MLILSLCGCGETIDLTGEGSEIAILEISADPKAYLGKTLRFSGYYTEELFYGETYRYVLKDLDGKENVGFEIRWEGEYPSPGTPVVAEGKLTEETVYGQAYIYVDVTELTVLQPVK